MTRAKLGLYMITSFPGKSSRSFTPAALLKKQLVQAPATKIELDGEAFHLLYENGNPAWYEGRPRGRRARTSAPPRVPKTFARNPSTRSRLKRVEPSEQEQTERNASWLFAPQSSEVLAFGEAIHSLFEQVSWIEEADIDAITAAWPGSSIYSDEVTRDVLEQFRKAMQADEVRQALSRPEGNAEIWREKRFEIVMRSRLVAGALDRVTILRDDAGRATAATVLDYKSDRIDTKAGLKQAAARHEAQLDLYAEALAMILGLPPSAIEREILFTRPARVHRFHRA